MLEQCLRPALAEDALCLSVLAMQVFLDTYATQGIRPALAREVLTTYSQSTFEAAIAEAETRLIVAEHKAHLVGFAQLTLGATQALAPAGHPAELLRLYVQEPFTGAQVGTRLLAQAEGLDRPIMRDIAPDLIAAGAAVTLSASAVSLRLSRMQGSSAAISGRSCAT